MSYAALAAIAAEVGAPVIRDYLSRKIGAGNAEIVTDIAGVVARRAGVPADALGSLVETDPGRIRDAIVDAEPEAAEMAAVYTAELEAKTRAFAVEDKGPFLAWAWRPLGMYVVFGLWIWNWVGLHVLNAIFKIALPPIPDASLVQVTALYLSLYMGGHTVKSVLGGARSRADA